MTDERVETKLWELHGWVPLLRHEQRQQLFVDLTMRRLRRWTERRMRVDLQQYGLTYDAFQGLITVYLHAREAAQRAMQGPPELPALPPFRHARRGRRAR